MNFLRTPQLSSFVLAALLATPNLLAQAAPPAPAADPWALIHTLRSSLAAAAPLLAQFEQTFLPAGFAAGETESGSLSLALPDCLRWDYAAPDPKSFLLCGESAYSWNQGESSGHYLRVAAREEPGLDLLLLPTADLERRYAASVKASASGGSEIWLAPLDPASHAPVSSTLELDATGTRILAIAYADRDGNRTRFVLSDYRTLRVEERARFSPPNEIRWLED
jgi:outer membrane lipoprotein-sorting protein